MTELVGEVDVRNAMRSVTMTVKLRGMRVLAIRRRVGIALIRLAAWVIGCHVEVET